MEKKVQGFRRGDIDGVVAPIELGVVQKQPSEKVVVVVASPVVVGKGVSDFFLFVPWVHDGDPDTLDAQLTIGTQTHVTAEHFTVWSYNDRLVLPQCSNLLFQTLEVGLLYLSGVLVPTPQL